MLELKAILLTQGMHGMVSQVEGLAKALGLNYKHQTVALKPFWNLIPPKFCPISENLVKNNFVIDVIGQIGMYVNIINLLLIIHADQLPML